MLMLFSLIRCYSPQDMAAVTCSWIFSPTAGLWILLWIPRGSRMVLLPIPDSSSKDGDRSALRIIINLFHWWPLKHGWKLTPRLIPPRAWHGRRGLTPHIQTQHRQPQLILWSPSPIPRRPLWKPLFAPWRLWALSGSAGLASQRSSPIVWKIFNGIGTIELQRNSRLQRTSECSCEGQYCWGNHRFHESWKIVNWLVCRRW